MGVSTSGLPVVNYRSNMPISERKSGAMVVREDNASRAIKSHRSISPGDPMSASGSTTTFSY